MSIDNEATPPPAIVELAQSIEFGTASWYGESHRGKRMANGELFNPDDPTTCASWYYPFGTKLRVTSKTTGASVEVIVRDRGPAKHLVRIIDLSKAAFAKIRSPKFGLDSVVVEVIK